MSESLNNGCAVVLAGPAGVGKSTIVSRLRNEVPDLFFSVSMTTRDPRPGEVHGRDYLYVTREEFQGHIDAGEMLEWAEIHGGLQLSGTPRIPVEEALSASRPVLIEVDVVGARNVKKLLPEVRTVFLAPPSWEVLVERLTGRGTESQEIIDRRLETAKVEMDARSEFDHIVVNDDLDKTVADITALLMPQSSTH
ncbi:guanylate kinase [Corynebacterium sp. 320]|uniref:Guanylate kinase n=1 Tax=Corynebacterium zhongnanshanii TaxID=2768834 RepID=A0ABQ6VGC3_9CORY|nr:MULTISPECIES: guanylate kinase [Corynebacterium]KAB1503694.1 guanylate kinase [Corynebacterium sp. 320]KAB1553205.1 guanylate kinase [Corynebacterium sp. 321]KAB1553576.1 guanylate kinase [Corynebacterium sp. 319]KAB3523455.1 guanylate kinase [Corynebacterium zhongnanshanii]KAB3527830.1 guanylate kinase [Corynebacterium sp. 250]